MAGASPSHDHDRISPREPGRFGVGRGRFAVCPPAEGRRQEARVQTRHRDAELVEGPLTDSDGAPGLDIVSRHAAAACDHEQLYPRRKALQQLRKRVHVARVVFPRNEDRTAEGDDDFLHEISFSTQKVMNDK